MAATKDEERKALAMIKEIVEDLGKDSYIGIAFEGCFEIAEENIENDFACSMKQRLESAEKKHYESFAEARRLKAMLSKAERDIERLQEELDKELGWHDCDGGTTMSQKDYETLSSAGRELTDDEARELVSREFGFVKDRIEIVDEVDLYEANKYRQMRVKETYERKPVYDASDWNYVRFNCHGWFYEMVNGELNQYSC